MHSFFELKCCCRHILHLWDRYKPDKTQKWFAMKLRVWSGFLSLNIYTGRGLNRKGELSSDATRKNKISFPAYLMPSSEHIKSFLCFFLLAESFVAEICFWELNNIEHDEIRHDNDRTSIRNWWSSELAEFQQFWDFRNSHWGVSDTRHTKMRAFAQFLLVSKQDRCAIRKSFRFIYSKYIKYFEAWLC